MVRHFLEVDDLTPAELATVLDMASRPATDLVLARRGVALLFEKPSARTRHSMEIATIELGGHPLYVRPEEVGLDTRESVEDVARVLMGYHAVIAARVFEHNKLERMAAVSSVPVVNLLSDDAHPIQVLADLLTIRQQVGRLDGVTVAYIGDANNMARSLAIGLSMCGARLRVAHPEGYGFSEAALARLAAAGAGVDVTTAPAEAATGADVLYTDAWYSMGQEAEMVTRRRDFAGFQVDTALMSAAAPDAIFMHCLPAHRGDEASDEVLDGPRSVIFPQAHNRLHSARGLLEFLVRAAGNAS
ncbi:MAG TPA: ornithine carbamoyltransferase [Microthrixaceae bacterium]|nr:ornithine carbamoyltransferase [Microthrixaceae bacterium]